MKTNLLFLGVNCREYDGKKYYKASFIDEETDDLVKLSVTADDASALIKHKRFDPVDVHIRTAQKGYDVVLFSCVVDK